MVIDGMAWTAEGNKHECAEKHLQYLIYWGLNGGLIGGYETFVTYGMPVLYEHIKKYPDCEMLILGSTEDIERFKQEHLRLSQYDMRIHVESYDHIVFKDDRYKTWDIVAVIEPEIFFTELSRNGYSGRIRIMASCILCFPYEIANQKGSTHQWMTDLLGYKENSRFENYLIRDCRKRQSLPDPYVFPDQLPENELFGKISANANKQSDVPNELETNTSVNADLSNDRARYIDTNEHNTMDIQHDPFVQITLDGPESKGTPIPPGEKLAAAINQSGDKKGNSSSLITKPAFDSDHVVQMRQESNPANADIWAVNRSNSDENEEISQRPDAVAEAVKEKKAVFINRDRLAILRQESDLVRDTLLAANLGEKAAEESQSYRTVVKASEAKKASISPDVQEVRTGSGARISINRDSLANLRRETDEVLEAILATTRDVDAQEEEPDQEETYGRYELMGPIGESLISAEGKRIIGDERYKEEQTPLISTARKGPNWSYRKEGLNEEWISFFETVDIDSVAAIMQGRAALDKYAKKRGVMPDVLIDDINTVANDTIGDLLIDGQDAIYEEYSDIIESHLTKE